MKMKKFLATILSMALIFCNMGMVAFATEPETTGELTFTDSDTYDVPTGTVSTAIDEIDISGAVTGGTKPYTFSKESGRDWINVSTDGKITGTRPDFNQNAATGSIKVTDGKDTRTITISVGAVTGANVAAEPIFYTDLEATKTVKVGESVTFNVSASTLDNGSLSYQWYKDETAIDGATSNSYTISSASAEDTGNYKVVVTNTNGSLTKQKESTVCTLTVKQTYTITVTDGTANPATAEKGDTVTITADTKVGCRFKNWTVNSGGVTLANASANSTTFTMPAENVEVTANYDKTYKIDIKKTDTGTGGGGNGYWEAPKEAIAGESVTIRAIPNGDCVFNSWTEKNTFKLIEAAKPENTFTMPEKDIFIEVTFSVKSNKYPLTIDKGNGSINKLEWPPINLVQLTIYAVDGGDTIPTGKIFKRWEVVSGNITITNPESISAANFIMPAKNVEVEAIFVTVKVNGGTADNENAIKDETVTITATPPKGKIFEKWEVNSGGVTLNNDKDSTTTFTKPAAAVEVTAIFRDMTNEEKFAADKTAMENALASLSVSNDTTADEILKAVNDADIYETTATWAENSPTITKATTSEKGLIEGTININFGIDSDTNSATINVNKEIAKLASTGSGSTGSGSGSQGGSSSGNSSNEIFEKENLSNEKAPISKTETAGSSVSNPKKTITTVEATKAVDTAIKNAISNITAGKTSKAKVTFANVENIAPTIFKDIVDKASSKGVTTTVLMDSIGSDKKYMGRMYIDPVIASKLSKPISTVIDNSPTKTENKKTVSKFNKFFNNKISTVTFNQKGEFGMNVPVAIKVNTKGMNIKNLKFYSYDIEKNSYKSIDTNYAFDAGGFLHLTTPYGGTLIVSDGVLNLK